MTVKLYAVMVEKDQTAATVIQQVNTQLAAETPQYPGVLIDTVTLNDFGYGYVTIKLNGG